MAVIRKRLLIWLVKAYIKRLGKRIFIFFIFGLIGFFLILSLIKYFIPRIPVGEKESIGIVGAYTLDSLPPAILSELSKGLTIVDENGNIKPGIARKWIVQDEGKTFVFYLKDSLYFSDKSHLDSSLIDYNFSDAKTIRPDKRVIVYKLKESFSPFLTTVSRPIFKKGFVGLGNYKIKDIDLNGNFVQSINLVSVNDAYKVKTYHFYPSYQALKTAFLLGEISKMIDLNDLKYKDFTFDKFHNVKVDKKTDYSQMATLFYNTQDSVLSDKKLRNSLSYAIPNSMPFGERSFSPYPPSSWAYTDQYIKSQDLDHAKLLMKAANTSTDSAKMDLTIKTFSKYEETAKYIAKLWKEIGINTKIEIVENVPEKFQIFLGIFYVPSDPDQYTLWHSNQDNNITKFENKRIDKYLEDGRKISDKAERQKIYFDFQKYLLDESPASFLYFPYEYEVTRK